ncbi:hypothetical protein [Marinicella sp. W31]|uniref:hypothetical protein n=1 Tax=Marinicella sp. W31 TaxID=3023713 RepID=UPI003757DB1D
MQTLISLFPHHSEDQLQQLYDQAIAFLTFDHAVKVIFDGQQVNSALLQNPSLKKRFNGLLLYGAEFCALNGHPALQASELDFDIAQLTPAQLQALISQSEVLL